MIKVVAASCAKIKDTPNQSVWTDIQNEQPDVLLLLGDNIYLDHDHHGSVEGLQNELRRLYDQQFAEPHFAALIRSMRSGPSPKKILSIYDDHDFLGNNRYGGDHDDSLRLAAREVFVSKFRPTMTGDDVYSISQTGLVDIVVLDERFYRTSPSVSKDDRNAILGTQQWNWLEQVVANSRASYLVLASSTTIHQWGDESWEQYHTAFDRLRQLIGKSRRNGAMVISGDIHQNATYDDSGILEIVTSGVARKGLVWGEQRRNYGVFEFDEREVRVQLRSKKEVDGRTFSIPLNNWNLP